MRLLRWREEMKINQGNTSYTFQCKRCVAVFRKQAYLDEHMEIVHRVTLETPKTRVKNNRKASVKVSNRQLKGE